MVAMSAPKPTAPEDLPDSRAPVPTVPPPPHAGSPAPRTPPAARGELGCAGRLLAGVIACVSVAYLVNPTAGVFELLPDNIPGVGNLDEAFFTVALMTSLGALGLRLPFLRR
jgi:hypothetical protein